MVAIAIFVLLLRIAIDQIIKINIAHNQATATETLKLISLALENYAKDNQGAFPLNLSQLTQTTPQYLDKDYISDSPIKGYIYGCSRMEATGYSCSALPVKCGLSAEMNYYISSNGSFISEKCEKRE